MFLQSSESRPVIVLEGVLRRILSKPHRFCVDDDLLSGSNFVDPTQVMDGSTGQANAVEVDDLSAASHHKLYDDLPLLTGERLLRLLTLQRDKKGDIIGGMTLHHLDDPTVQWYALSYTWQAHENDPEKEGIFSITINGYAFNVRTNLYHALHALLDEDGAMHKACPWSDDPLTQDVPQPEPRYFWIDAICIDQSLTTERNHQVALMKDIFQRAKCVISWLTPIPCESVPPEVRADYTEPNSRLWDAIVRNPYWKRMWIIQEFVLARKVLLLYDNTWMEPESFDLNEISGPMLTIMVARQDDQTLLKRSLNRAKLQRRERTKSKRLIGNRLSGLMVFFQRQECSDPKDRIYALLGLVPSTYKLRPDYSKSILEILSDILKVEKDLRSDHDSKGWLHICARKLGVNWEDAALTHECRQWLDEDFGAKYLRQSVPSLLQRECTISARETTNRSEKDDMLEKDLLVGADYLYAAMPAGSVQKK